MLRQISFGGRLALAAALLVVVASARPFHAAAQESPSRTRVWLDAGFTAATGGGVESGLGYITQFNLQKRRRVYALRLVGILDFEGFPDSGGERGAGEFGVLYGRSHVRRRVRPRRREQV